MFTFTHHGALIPYDNAKLKGRTKWKNRNFQDRKSLLLFSEVYIFCTNMCFLTTVYVYQLKTQTPWDSDYESKNNFEDQYTANIFIDKNTIF